MFRSTDDGLTWGALGSGRLTKLGVYSLTVSGTTLLAGTAHDGTWQYPL